MDYYLNEYSLRGQFKDVDEFFEKLRTNTLPVLRMIEKKKENIVWKKDTFWQSEICKGINLTRIPQKRNERSAEWIAMQIQLIKLVNSEPFWESGHLSDLKIKEYNFDKEYREYFEDTNCFTKALENEGRIISFVHPSYNISKLPVVVRYDELEEEYCLDNIFETAWWESEPEVKTWNISGKYTIQVRAKEFEYHPPHFHAISNEYAAVFRLNDGQLYKCGKKKWSPSMLAEIKEWYEIHKFELQEAWKLLHCV